MRVGVRARERTLEDIAGHSVNGTLGSLGQGRGMAALNVEALTRRLNSDQMDLLVVEETGEDADGIGAAANTSNNVIGESMTSSGRVLKI